MTRRDNSSNRFRGIEWSFVVLGLGLCSALILWHFIQHALLRVAKDRFAVSTQEAIAGIDKHVTLYLTILRGLEGLYAASNSVERDEFSAYCRMLRLLHVYPGIASVQFIQRVPAQERAAFVRRVQADTALEPSGYPDFHLHPESAEAESYVVTYVEPQDGNERLLGFDVVTEPMRRSAVERARDTGQSVATGRLTLVTDQEQRHPAFVVFLPVYRNDALPATVEKRRQALVGLVAGSFNAEEFFAGMLARVEFSSEVDFEVFDADVLTDDLCCMTANLSV